MQPFDILEIPPGATEEEIRAAYLSKVKEHPPDRSPAQFERIRDAYETLRDPRRRMRHMLFAVDPTAPFVALVDHHTPRRRFAGPGPWRDVLNDK